MAARGAAGGGGGGGGGSTPPPAAAGGESIQVGGDTADPQRIVRLYRQMLEAEEAMNVKVLELGQEMENHKRVLATMEKYGGDRRCYRRVGDTLVEGTSRDVAAEVRENLENISKLLETLKTDLTAKTQQRLKFQIEHKIQTIARQ